MVTPSSVLQIDLRSRAETLLKQEPVSAATTRRATSRRGR